MNTSSRRWRGKGHRPVLPALAACALGLAALAGCGGTAPPGEGAPEAAPDTVEGTVRQIGSTPFTRTVVEGSDTVAVAGSLGEEVARLSGARVRVTGTLSTGEYPGPTLEVADYEVLSVDGERPVVGVLAVDDEGYFLRREGDSAVRLRAVGPGLRGQVGARVWVVSGGNGAVRRYGILRPPEQ